VVAAAGSGAAAGLGLSGKHGSRLAANVRRTGQRAVLF
jgi:hypothetical protein